VSESAEKITDAVETCLAFAVGKSDPFTRVSAYLKSLRDDGDWKADDIVEVQTRVIRALMTRITNSELS
jgi:hypothetical protein